MTKLAAIKAAGALALALAGPAAAQDPGADTVVATVDGTEITLGHMIVAREQVPQQYQQLPDQTLYNAILEQLVQQTALAQATDAELPLRDRLSLENQRRSRRANAALGREARDSVDETALRAAYQSEFVEPGPQREYNASHILVESREKAAEIAAQLADGADFATLAEENSSDGSSARGGDLGWFGEGDMVQPFGEAVAGMEVGEISEPVETDFGWHVIRLDDTRMSEVPAFEDVRGQLEQQVQRKAAQALIEEVTGAAEIKRNDDAVDPSVLRDASILGN